MKLGMVGGLFLAGQAWFLLANPSEDPWPRFRGPEGNGISSARNLPVKWSEGDLRWKVALPGKGHASPVVWQDRVFVTSADDATADRYVLCFHAGDGRKAWEKKLPSRKFELNRENSYASSTPAVDDRGLYLYWTTPEFIEVTALDLDGRERWVRKLGPYKSRHGSGASPVAVDGLVWINNDQDGPSSLLAFDGKSGEIRHQIERRADKAAYATPCLWSRAGHPSELIFAASSHGLTSVDPIHGTVNWDCTNLFEARIVGSPVASDGLIICSSGEGGVGRRLVAVRPPEGRNPPAVAYELKSAIPYIPTPLAKDGRLYLLGDNGLLRCVRTATGEPLWQEKLPDRFYSSPVWAAGRLYLTSKTGVVFVVAVGEKPELLAQNALGEPSFATPAIAQETLFFRTVSHLIAVGGNASASRDSR